MPNKYAEFMKIHTILTRKKSITANCAAIMLLEKFNKVNISVIPPFFDMYLHTVGILQHIPGNAHL
jgi:hypothetical protein